MIDPKKITNYNLSTSELQKVLIWWIFAAGHNGVSTAKGIEKFTQKIFEATCSLGILNLTTFDAIAAATAYRGWSFVLNALSSSGLGCWRRKSETIYRLVFELKIDLRTRAHQTYWAEDCPLFHSSFQT